MMIEEYSPRVSDTKFFFESLDKRPTRRQNLKIEEFAESLVVPTGKFRGQKYKHSTQPLLKEPLSLLGPHSPFTVVICMFPAQFGKSTIGENATLYYTKAMPSEIIFVSSNSAMARKWSERRIEPRAISAGVIFRSQTENKHSRRSGDTTFSKEFDGGNIDFASALSINDLSSETKRIAIADELDRWRKELGDEGSPFDALTARTQAWGDTKKIFVPSTPTTEEGSLTYQLYLMADQRNFFSPCEKCGEHQYLGWMGRDGYGLTYQTKSDVIISDSVEYICKKCGHAHKEKSKIHFNNEGEWRATAKTSRPGWASFHANGLHSPFIRWHELAEAHREAEGDPAKTRTFYNLKMGLPYRDQGSRPDYKKIINNRGKYKSETVPDGVLYLTMAVDVQSGAVKYEGLSGKELDRIIQSENISGKIERTNLPRLEIEVLGHGKGYRTWSVCYKRFYGRTDIPFVGAWEKLNEWAIETGLSFKRRSDGREFDIKLIGIDAGDGKRTETVYTFCEGWQATYPIKGFRELQRRKNEKKDEATGSQLKRYRAAKSGTTVFYEISTKYYKDQVYGRLKIERTDLPRQKAGFMDFPQDYSDFYFEMLTNEEKLIDGTYEAGNRPNEALDLKGYNFALGNIWLDAQVLNMKAQFKKQGLNDAELQAINWNLFLDQLVKATGNESFYAT